MRARTEPAPVAAVDCGTNSTRLIVVDARGVVQHREMRITRLGEGVDATHSLSSAAIARTLDVLRDYRAVMDGHGVDRVRVVATSAARDADNTAAFMEPAQEIVGVRPEVLPGGEEGRLSFLGATAHLPGSVSTDAPVLVCDIGGGSTELSVGRPAVPGARPATVDTRSLDVGCVRVSERFLAHDPPRPAEVAQARESIETLVVEAKHGLPAPDHEGPLVGLAGTVATLSSLVHGITTYDRATVHHSTFERHDVDHWLHELGQEDARARLRRPGVSAGREDVIVGGLLVLSVVMDVFDRTWCLASEDDILDGLADDLLRQG